MILTRKNPVYWMLWPCDKMLNWRPKSLCTISFGLVLSLLLSLGWLIFWTIVAMAMLYVGIVLIFPVFQFFVDFTQFGLKTEMLVGASFVLWLLIGAIFIGSIISDDIEQRNHENIERTRNGKPPLEKNAIIEFFKVHKKKVCPTVEYNDW